MKNDKKPFRRPFTFFCLKNIFRPFAYFHLHYRRKSKYKIAKGEKVVVIANHQTDYDPLLILLSFNKLIRCLATDNIFAGKNSARFMTHLGIIPKRKGLVDIKSTTEMLSASNNGDSLMFFPEGNRSYGEFQFYISPHIGRLLKSLKSTLIIFNLHGGFGTLPRIGSKQRKGKFYGEIRSVIHYEDYKDMSEEELFDLVKSSTRVFDSESGNLYKSNKRAEYFERLFFVCPKCGELNQMYSEGNYLRCRKCGCELEYTEDLHLKSNDVSFTKLVEYYNYQKRFIKDYDFSKMEVIFQDKDVSLTLANPYQKKYKLEKKSSLTLTQKELVFDHHRFNLSDILVASPVSGRKLCFTIGDNNYTIKGDERFNAIKYMFLFHKLDTLMKQKNIDDYFSLKEDEK